MEISPTPLESAEETDMAVAEKTEKEEDAEVTLDEDMQETDKKPEEAVQDKDIAEPKEEPESPADEAVKEEDTEIGDPSEAVVIDEIEGVSDTNGERVLEALKKYGFSAVDGLEAPDGSVTWSVQSENYYCDIQADSDGNIYNSVFTAAGEEYAEYLSDCAGVFSEKAAAWVIDNADANTSTEIGEFFISISEAPGGHSLQICSADYKNTVSGPGEG